MVFQDSHIERIGEKVNGSAGKPGLQTGDDGARAQQIPHALIIPHEEYFSNPSALKDPMQIGKTDFLNPDHTSQDNGGNLAAANAVAWMFAKKGFIVIEKAKAAGNDEEKLMTAVLDAGADDLQDDDDNWEVISAPEAFQAVHDAVKQLGIEPATAQVSMIPQNYVKLEGKPAQQMVRLMEALEDHDDVQHVWSNFDIEEKEIEASLA